MDYHKLLEYITFITVAHQEKINQFGKTIRKSLEGNETPYFTHPLWCCLMMLHEPLLDDSIRIPGAIALLFHDLLEDTTQHLPEDISEKAKYFIEQMTVEKEAKYNFSSWEKEKLNILEKPIEIQLLKLYDKAATLADMVIKEERISEWATIVGKLAINVEKQYGRLNIVLFAKDLAQERLKEVSR